MNDYMDYIKGIKTYIDDSANKIQDKVAEIVRIDDIKDLNKMQTKKYRHRNNNKQPSLVTSGEVSQAEIELQKLQQQNHQLHEKMKELEEQRTNLRFQLGKYRQLIADKRKLLNKECRDGFQLLTQTRRPRIMSEKKSKSPQLFLTSTSTMSQKKLTQVHILLRDVMKVERQPPIIRSNRRYTFDQFMQLNKTEYFSYIHNHLPKIKEYFLEFSFKRTKQFKTL
ncbi:unnamed protein product [Paramecium octaurelia]|uniref:Uncharacterized protein n=1 Tax=Paramecium octaurelia TaxID=43137 RepID=A0A8S1YRN7_PAROT|nr:unnamed protein product [Paramecium octaurelia]CAD8214504.1 unnamed protein product [Paramecium octaurelia]